MFLYRFPRRWAPFALLALSACDFFSGGSSPTPSSDMGGVFKGLGGSASGPVTLERAPLTSTCPSCGRDAGEGHSCRLTKYCGTCRRETYPDHIHFRTVPCETCGRERGHRNHVCHQTRICPNPACTGNDEIWEVSVANHLCGLTRFCPECRIDRGEGHIHGETYFCVRCRKEVGKDTHLCDVSMFCPECRTERSIQIHEHGLSRFCADCRLEVGIRGHVHGQGRFCPVCGSEAPLNHADHKK